MRHLLRLGGQIDYTNTGTTFTLDRPDSPRVAPALTLLTKELNATPASLPGDRRPLSYQVRPPEDIAISWPSVAIPTAPPETLDWLQVSASPGAD